MAIGSKIWLHTLQFSTWQALTGRNPKGVEQVQNLHSLDLRTLAKRKKHIQWEIWTPTTPEVWAVLVNVEIDKECNLWHMAVPKQKTHANSCNHKHLPFVSAPADRIAFVVATTLVNQHRSDLAALRAKCRLLVWTALIFLFVMKETCKNYLLFRAKQTATVVLYDVGLLSDELTPGAMPICWVCVP